MFKIYHAVGRTNELCLPGQDYFLAGQVLAQDLYSAYLRSICLDTDRQTFTGDIIQDISSNQCYLVMTEGFYPVNSNWIQTKTR